MEKFWGAMKIAYIFACALTFDGGEAAGVQQLFERGDTKNTWKFASSLTKCIARTKKTHGKMCRGL